MSILPLVGTIKNAKIVHRIVVLPEYQGIGIGSKFINEIGRMYKELGCVMYLKTSNIALVRSSRIRRNWQIKKSSFSAKHKNFKSMNKTIASNRITYSMKYVGENRCQI
jgi:GNAT superfamily N-acetyltransferase